MPVTKDVRYKVTAALAILPDETSGQVYVYEGGLIPSNASEGTIKHLLESHIISPVE